MKKHIMAFTVLAIMTTACSLLAFANEKVSQVSVKTLDDAAFEKMIELNQPSEMHALLSNLRGEWNYVVKVWEKPDVEPQQSNGTSVNEMILGNRYISIKSSGILNIGGHYLPFESEGLVGYDNKKKVFTSAWADTLNPGIMVGNGTLDQKDNLITENGNLTSIVDETVESYRSELQFTDSENFKRLIFVKDKSSKEYKAMEFEYSKKK